MTAPHHGTAARSGNELPTSSPAEHVEHSRHQTRKYSLRFEKTSAGLTLRGHPGEISRKSDAWRAGFRSASQARPASAALAGFNQGVCHCQLSVPAWIAAEPLVHSREVSARPCRKPGG